jgi:hypothetical protein
MKPRRSGFGKDLADVNNDVVLPLSEVIVKYETLYRYAPSMREEDFAKEMKKHDDMLANSIKKVTKADLMLAIVQLLKNNVKDVEYHKRLNVWTGEKRTETKIVGDINAFDSADMISKILLGVRDRQLLVSALAELLNLKHGEQLIDELETRVGSVEEEDLILDARNLYADSKPQMNAARMFGEKTKQQAAPKPSAKKQEKQAFVGPSLGDSPGKK